MQSAEKTRTSVTGLKQWIVTVAGTFIFDLGVCR